MIPPDSAWSWVEHCLTSPEETPLEMRERFRVEAVPSGNGVRFRQWRVVDDDQGGKVIYPATDLHTANKTANRLNTEKHWTAMGWEKKS